jgi:predicted phage terminase large subunit-like protein
VDISKLSEEEQNELLLLLASMEDDKKRTSDEQTTFEEKRRLESSFTEFAKAAWTILEPGNPLSWSWHYDLIAEYLSLAAAKKCRRLIINIPPRTLKSMLVTVMFPVWVWCRVKGAGVSTANQSFVCASYAQGLSEEHSVKRRRLLESAWFQRLWGDRVWLQKDQNQKSKFQNNFQAQMFATSVGGTLTGIGGNFLIVDDGLKPDEVASEAIVTSLHTWFSNTWRSRLNNPSEDVMIIVEQRTGELDLTGYCQEADKQLVADGKDPEWTTLCIPLEADEDAVDSKTLTQKYVYPVSGTVHERPLGDVLQPDRFTPSVVNAWKILRHIWTTQYQGRPTSLEGNMIKLMDIMYYGGMNPHTGENDIDLPDRFDVVITSTDCAFKDTKTSDFVCVGTVGVKGPNRFILEVVTKHLDSPATEKEINRQRLKWKARANLVEDKANGSAVIASMRKKVAGMIAVDPEGGKVSRMYAVCGEWQAHNWYVDRNAAWTGPFIEHITKFPGIRYDDDVDMMTQAGVYLQAHGFKSGFVAWLLQQQEEDMKNRKWRQDTLAAATGVAVKEEVAHTAADEMVEFYSPFSDKVPNVRPAAIAKIPFGDNTPRCQNVVDGEICGCAILQRVPGGIRCAQCGHQEMKNVLSQPVSAGQVRKMGRVA